MQVIKKIIGVPFVKDCITFGILICNVYNVRCPFVPGIIAGHLPETWKTIKDKHHSYSSKLLYHKLVVWSLSKGISPHNYTKTQWWVTNSRGTNWSWHSRCATVSIFTRLPTLSRTSFLTHTRGTFRTLVTHMQKINILQSIFIKMETSMDTQKPCSLLKYQDKENFIFWKGYFLSQTTYIYV